MYIRHLAILSLLVAGLAIPSTAVATGEELNNASIVLDGGSNENYASVEDGTLRIQANQLNDHATTHVDDVFTITSAANTNQRVSVDAEAEGVTFYRNGNPDTTVENVRLSTGETISVGISLDTRRDVDGDFTITVESNDGPSIRVTDASLDRIAIQAGQSANVTATVENRGTEGGTYSADLTVDGVTVAQRAVYVPAGERRTVTFERTFQQPGEYEIGVDDASAGTITVREPPAGAASFEVHDAALSETSIEPGESVDVTATVANAGRSVGEFTAELAVGGVVLETRTVRLDAGETTTVTFTRTFEQPGAYEVAVSGAAAGQLDVSSPESSGAEAVERQLRTPATSVVGLSLVAGALLVSRRRPRELLGLLR